MSRLRTWLIGLLLLLAGTAPARAEIDSIARGLGASAKSAAAAYGHPGFRAATWYPPMASGGFGAVSGTADFLYCAPIVVPFSGTLVGLGVTVTTTTAGAHVKLALYNNVAGVPNTLLASVGAISTAVPGDYTGVISVAVTRGVYWGCALLDTSGLGIIQIVGTDPVAAWAVGGATPGAVLSNGNIDIGYTNGAVTYAGGFLASFGAPAYRVGNVVAVAFKMQ